jgi:membrane protein insertase Oxa1/YidC/SpoIIIJ
MLANGGEVYSSVAGSGYEALSFKVGPLNLGEIPSLSTFNWLLLIPVLTFVVYFFSMRLTKKFTYQPSGAMMGADGRQAACSGWMMDIMMPLMSVYITFMVPALIGVYWIFKSIISTLSRFILTRVMPYPQFTEEDYRAAEREYAGKAPKKQAPGQYAYSKDTKMVGGKPKSLFHMDDDDYMAKVAKESAEQEAEQSTNTRVEGEALKKDDRPEKQEKKDDGE